MARRSSRTGPKNLASSVAAATAPVRKARARPSRAATPRMSPARASAGYGAPPAGAGSGIAKASTPMAKTPSKTINKSKTGRPGRGLGKPRADFPSRI